MNVIAYRNLVRRSVFPGILILVVISLLSGCAPGTAWYDYAIPAPEPIVDPIGRSTVETVAEPAAVPMTQQPLAELSISAQNIVAGETTLTLVDQVGGQSLAIDATGYLSFLAVGPRLVTIDHYDAANPRLLGESPPLPAMIEGLDVPGYGYAYAAAGPAGLAILDVNIYSMPQLVSLFPLPRDALQVFTRYDVAMVTGGHCPNGPCQGSLYLVDIAEAETPALLSATELPDYPNDVVAAGRMAYVAHGIGVEVIDVGDPVRPRDLATIEVPGGARSLALDEGRLFVAGDGIRWYDLSEPANPRLINLYETDLPTGFVGVDGNYVFATEVFCEFGQCGTNLIAVDMAKPYRPKSAGILGLPGANSALVLVEDRALVDTANSGLTVVDSSDPKQLAIIGDVVFPGGLAEIAAIPGTPLLLAAGTSQSVLSIYEPVWGAAPKQIGSLDDMRWARGFTIIDNIAYVPVWQEGLKIVDLSDPTQPQGVGRISADEMEGAGYSVAVTGDNPAQRLAYVAVGDTGLRVLDVTDWTKPELLSKLDVPGQLWQVALAGGSVPGGPVEFLLAGGGADQGDGHKGILRIFDLGDPTLPHEVGSVELPADVSDIAVAGDLAYIATASCYYDICSGGLHIVDLSHRATPRLISSMIGPGGLIGVTASNDGVYVTAGEQGIWLLDVSDPDRPRPVAAGDVPGSARHIVVDPQVPGKLYVADSSAGLLVFEKSESQP
ncbi:MAG: hypothetical protein U9R25_11035 [Chloroflexota bacterium]|nr:hypothetical protein [Chloroflexota bacterium]